MHIYNASLVISSLHNMNAHCKLNIRRSRSLLRRFFTRLRIFLIMCSSSSRPLSGSITHAYKYIIWQKIFHGKYVTNYRLPIWDL